MYKYLEEENIFHQACMEGVCIKSSQFRQCINDNTLLVYYFHLASYFVKYILCCFFLETRGGT